MIAIDIDPVTSVIINGQSMLVVTPEVTDAQLARVHAELEEITSVTLFGENATDRARRLWSENQLRGGRTGTIPQNVLARKGQGT